MSKKPSFSLSKEKRLTTAKKELESEVSNEENTPLKQTTIMLESDLLYAIKEVALKRKRAGIEPNTLVGIIRDALKEIVAKELNK